MSLKPKDFKSATLFAWMINYFIIFLSFFLNGAFLDIFMVSFVFVYKEIFNKKF